MQTDRDRQHGRDVRQGHRNHLRADGGSTARDPMAARQIYTDLLLRGVRLRVEGGRVRWTAKTGVMSIDLIRRIKTHEPALVEILTGIELAVVEQEGA